VCVYLFVCVWGNNHTIVCVCVCVCVKESERERERESERLWETTNDQCLS